MFEVVDCPIGIARCRPRQARAAFVGGLRRQYTMIRHTTGDGTDDVERVERRNPRPRFGDVEAWIRQIQPLARRACGDFQQQTLGRPPLILANQARVERAAPLVEQQGIFVETLRHQALGEAWHEHHTKRAAPRLMRRAHEEATVSLRRRVPFERRQAIVKDIARLFERDRSNISHRPEVGQRLQHSRGASECKVRERGESLQPLAPQRTIGPIGKAVDHRQRELAQMGQVLEIALKSHHTRRFRLFLAQLREPVSEIRREAVETTTPACLAVSARPSPDDRRLDDELFPLPRRSQRAGHHRFLVRVGEIGLVVGGWWFVVRSWWLVFVDPRPETEGGTLGAGSWELEADLWNLPEREVLVEPLRGQSLDRAGDQGQKRPAGWIGAFRAPVEVDRNAAARARVVEEADVLLRSAKEDRHVVERHAPRRLVQHAPNDFHGLASFARRRKQRDVARALACRRAFRREDVTAQRRQIGRTRLRRFAEILYDGTQIKERRAGEAVSVRNGR